jgi:hypothetical protein
MVMDVGLGGHKKVPGSGSRCAFYWNVCKFFVLFSFKLISRALKSISGTGTRNLENDIILNSYNK